MRTLRLLSVALAVALALAACGSGGDDGDGTTSATEPAAETGPTTTTEAPCGPGGRTVERDGIRIREFCGPARALVETGEEILELGGGECERDPDSLQVHLGLEVLHPSEHGGVLSPPFHSFTLLLGRHPLAADTAVPANRDGTYNEGHLAFTTPGTSWVVDDKAVTLVEDRTAGGFVGEALTGGAREQRVEVRGAFTCDHEVLPLDAVPDLGETDETGDTDETGETGEFDGEGVEGDG